MARYTPEFLAALRRAYEDGDQPVDELAAEFHISTRTLGRLALRENWDRRSERVRDVPRAMRLLEEAHALGMQSRPAHSRDPSPQNCFDGLMPEPAEAQAKAGSGNPVLADGAQAEPPERLGSRFRGDERESAAAPPDCEQPSTPTLPLAGRGSSTAIDRLEQLVLQEIAGEEARRAPRRGERTPAATERGARSLAILTQTMQTLQRLRAGDHTPTDLPERDSIHDDDMPHDIDEFRRDLARRIEAFVASRTDESDARGDSDAAAVDEVR
ncbi:MAG: hypothetical protein HY848_18715 [Betaproteobacteria bacterium]|nr:hypothetical protein [Betaproteobacteria bacterium]